MHKIDLREIFERKQACKHTSAMQSRSVGLAKARPNNDITIIVEESYVHLYTSMYVL